MDISLLSSLSKMASLETFENLGSLGGSGGGQGSSSIGMVVGALSKFGMFVAALSSPYQIKTASQRLLGRCFAFNINVNPVYNLSSSCREI